MPPKTAPAPAPIRRHGIFTEAEARTHLSRLGLRHDEVEHRLAEAPKYTLAESHRIQLLYQLEFEDEIRVEG